MLFAMIAAIASAGEAKPLCRTTEPQHAGRSLYREEGGARAKKLGELPPGDHILAVLRKEDGCEVPVVVRSGIGGTPTDER